MCKNYEDIGILKHLTEICRSIDIFEVRVKAFPDKLRAVKITERQDCMYSFGDKNTQRRIGDFFWIDQYWVITVYSSLAVGFWM